MLTSALLKLCIWLIVKCNFQSWYSFSWQDGIWYQFAVAKRHRVDLIPCFSNPEVSNLIYSASAWNMEDISFLWDFWRFRKKKQLQMSSNSDPQHNKYQKILQVTSLIWHSQFFLGLYGRETKQDLPQSQILNRTKKAGSSLAHWSFVCFL